jgi:hypothetical protein
MFETVTGRAWAPYSETGYRERSRPAAEAARPFEWAKGPHRVMPVGGRRQTAGEASGSDIHGSLNGRVTAEVELLGAEGIRDVDVGIGVGFASTEAGPAVGAAAEAEAEAAAVGSARFSRHCRSC